MLLLYAGRLSGWGEWISVHILWFSETLRKRSLIKVRQTWVSYRQASSLYLLALKMPSERDYWFCKFTGNKAKGLSSKRVFQKNKARQIFWKTNIFYPRLDTCTYQGVRNVRFSENLTCFVFLKHSFWDSPFSLITDELIELMLHEIMNLDLRRRRSLCSYFPDYIKVDMLNISSVFFCWAWVGTQKLWIM